MSKPIDVLAIYGALLSSFTLGWNIFRDLLDKPKLKVTARLGRIVQNQVTGQFYAVKSNVAMNGASEQLFVFLDVTNVGRRPVRWDAWGGKHYQKEAGKDSFAVIPIDLPKMLTEGQSHTEWTAELHPSIDNVKQLSAWDAAGKAWSLPRRALRQLKKDIHKELGAK